jgi:methionine-rich copper-binding protein CopC
MIRNKQKFVSAGVAIMLLWLGTSSALAHAQLIKAVPADKAELKQVPAKVELWFNELLEEGFNSIEVIRAADLSNKSPVNLAKGKPKVDPADATHLEVELPALEPGEYAIEYRVLSRDGHTAPGRVMFRVIENKN